MTAAEQSERRRLYKARRSLLLVNTLINEEFTRFFYKSATIIVHVDKKALRKLKVRVPGDAVRCNAEEFEEHYLETARPEVLQMVRKIEYNLTPDGDNPSFIDHEVTDFVAVLLRYEEVLTSLTEVVAFGAEGRKGGEFPLAELLGEWSVTMEERITEQLD